MVDWRGSSGVAYTCSAWHGASCAVFLFEYLCLFSRIDGAFPIKGFVSEPSPTEDVSRPSEPRKKKGTRTYRKLELKPPDIPVPELGGSPHCTRYPRQFKRELRAICSQGWTEARRHWWPDLRHQSAGNIGYGHADIVDQGPVYVGERGASGQGGAPDQNLPCVSTHPPLLSHPLHSGRGLFTLSPQQWLIYRCHTP